MEKIWAIDNFHKESLWLTNFYKTDRVTADEIASISNIDIHNVRDYRVRTATADEIKQIEDGEARCVDLRPDCADWLLQRSFDGNVWPNIYRNTMLTEILRLARQSADGICYVSFRPATAEEIARDDQERAEEELEFQRCEMERRRGIRLGRSISVCIQAVLTILFAYWGVSISPNREILGLCLLCLAGLSALNLGWGLFRYVLYQISFTVGRGFRDGRNQSPHQ